MLGEHRTLTDRRDSLVISARELVRQGGMAALSLRTLADREGTSTQAIYTLFGGKRGLIQAIYSHWMIDLEHRLAEAASADYPPELLLWLTARLYREHALSDPTLFLAGSSNQDVYQLLLDSAAFKTFAGFVSAGMANGTLRRCDDPRTAAGALWGAVHGAVLFELHAGTDSGYLEQTLNLLLNGLANTTPG